MSQLFNKKASRGIPALWMLHFDSSHMSEEKWQLLEQEHPYDAPRLALDLPLPSLITYQELRELKPIYEQFINDVRENGASTLKLSSMEEPDRAIFLLYFSTYIVEIGTFHHRLGRSQGSFEMEDTVEGMIFRCPPLTHLTQWCRNALANDRNHNVRVIEGCLHHLASILSLVAVQGRSRHSLWVEFFENNFLADKGESDRGGKKTFEDLLRIVSRSDCSHALVFHATTLLQLIMDFQDSFAQLVRESPRTSAFERALKQHRSAMGEEVYRQMLITIRGAQTVKALTVEEEALPSVCLLGWFALVCHVLAVGLGFWLYQKTPKNSE